MGNEKRISSISKIADKFWKKVDIKGKDECWLWKGAKFSCGKTAKTIRGYFYYCGHTCRVHRLAWIITYGPIRNKKKNCVCHKCSNSLCVNPSHLFLGSPADNVRHMVSQGRQHKKITDDQVREIRRLAKYGVAKKDIAKQFKVSRPHVWGIIKGKYRKVLL